MWCAKGTLRGRTCFVCTYVLNSTNIHNRIHMPVSYKATIDKDLVHAVAAVCAPYLVSVYLCQAEPPPLSLSLLQQECCLLLLGVCVCTLTHNGWEKRRSAADCSFVCVLYVHGDQAKADCCNIREREKEENELCAIEWQCCCSKRRC